MGVVITRDDIIAYAEVDYIIHHMNEKYFNKVPEKLRTFFATIKDPTCEVYVNPRLPLQNQNLKKYTLELLALLHIKYWCEDEERRKELYEKMIENQRKLDAQMREKYNIDNMFDMNSAKVVTSESDLNNESTSSTEDDFSRPKAVTKYSAVAKENPDVQDFTDVQEEQPQQEDSFSRYLGEDKKTIEGYENEEKAIANKLGFITNFINKIRGIFSKKNA